MAYERFANGGLSSLSAGINNSVTSLTVKSAVGFPTGGNFRIVVDSEIMSIPIFPAPRLSGCSIMSRAYAQEPPKGILLSGRSTAGSSGNSPADARI